MNVNVGDIRKAIEGLPDEAPVCLLILYSEDSGGTAYVELVNTYKEEGRLVMRLEVTVTDDCDDDFDDDEDDLDDPEEDA